MFPLPVILIGVNEQALPGLRRDLADASATVEAEYGTVDAVTKSISGIRGQKCLFIVAFDSSEDAALVGKLANTYRNWPILALVGEYQQTANLVHANRAGAVQVVTMPVQSSDLHAALNSIARAYRPADQECRVLVFTGSVAGCGTTTIATNAAYEIAVGNKLQTVLIELASQMGVLATNLGVETPRTLESLLADEEHLDAALVRSSLVAVNDHFRILAASRNMVPGGGSIPVAGVLRVLDFVRAIANVAILDVPCTYDDFQFEILGSANHVILVGEQSITSVRTLKLILDAVNAGTGKYHVVINRYNAAVQGLSVLDLQRVLGVTEIHTIPDDRLGVLAAANEGKLIRQIDPRSSVVAAIDSLVDSMLNETRIEKPEARRGLLSRLFSSSTK